MHSFSLFDLHTTNTHMHTYVYVTTMQCIYSADVYRMRGMATIATTTTTIANRFKLRKRQTQITITEATAKSALTATAAATETAVVKAIIQ